MLLYRRDGCHLCDEAREALQAVLEERAQRGADVPAVRQIDIASDPELERRYLVTIPVLALDRDELPLATSARSIRSFLERVLDRERARA